MEKPCIELRDVLIKVLRIEETIICNNNNNNNILSVKIQNRKHN
jgi:hypothetical protein